MSWLVPALVDRRRDVMVGSPSDHRDHHDLSLDTIGRSGRIRIIRGKQQVRMILEVAVAGTERQFRIRPDAAAREGAP